MNPILLLSDANTIGGLANSFIDTFAGGDWLLLGIIVFAFLAFFLIITRVKAGGVVAIGIGFAYLLSLFNPVFQFIFWIGIFASVLGMIILGFRRQTTQ